ncbi:MAG: hypothetical protein ACMUHU_00635 [Thermoplasmatota archaeon]
MRGPKRRIHRDNWGKRPDDPFLRDLMEDPKRAARLSMAFTIGMVLFWLFFVVGMMIVAAFMIFG